MAKVTASPLSGQQLRKPSKIKFLPKGIFMKLKTKKILSVIVLSVYLVSLYFMLDYMTDYPLWVLISAFASVVFMIATHELGHLIFGYLTGYRFVSYRIFSLPLLKENGKFRLNWQFVLRSCTTYRWIISQD